ncbi:hypothetical protein [Spirillospora sp. NPDC029432]|uniref:DUF6973 domain-containing protein n=1 Tax=Spirillospora sp. NPDC029432 TaxID=3154599 RepID=UPI0034531D99
MSFEQLRDVRLGPVGEAADAWLQLARRLEAVRDGVRARLLGQLIEWRGPAASAAYADVAVLHAKVNAASIHAKAVHQRLGYAARQFTKAQRQLRDAIEDARAARLVVGRGGALEYSKALVEADPSPLALLAVKQRHMDPIAARFRTALQIANEADRQVSSLLGALGAEAIEDPHQWLRHPNDVPGRRPLSEILARYQINDDPNGMTRYPDGLPGLLYDALGKRRENLTDGERDIIDAHPAEALKAGKIKDFVWAESERRYEGRGVFEGHGDAFRHAYWNAVMHIEMGETWSKDFTTAHERQPGNRDVREAMDLHNNEVGRQIAREHPHASREELAGHVEQAVRDGRLVVIDRDVQLRWSDTVPPGQTAPEQAVSDPRRAATRPGHDPRDLPPG